VAAHIDLVENRWSGGYQERVGTVQVSGGQPEVEPSNERYTHYRDIVLGALPEVMAASVEKWFHTLPQHFHSDYFFATEPHDERQCPFAGGDQVAISVTETAQRHAVSA
jgi:hypothetical protein